MNNEGTFGTYEAICLTTLIMINKIFYTSASVLVETVGTAAWYETIISCMVSLFFFYLIYLLMKRFPGQDITRIYEIVLGRVIGKVVTLIFSVYILYYAASNLREFIEMIKVYNLPYTPSSILILGFIIVATIIAYFGLEGVARMSGVLLIPVMLSIIAVLLFAIPLYNVDYIKPYFGYGLQKTIVVGILRSSAYEEFFILTVIINSIHGLKNFKRVGIISIVITGITFTISMLCYLMAFHYSTGSESLSGLFQLSRIIIFNRYVQRLESIFLFAWVVSSLIAVSCAFYISISLYTKAFTINNHRPIIFPFSFLLFMIALMPKNISEVIQVNILFIRQYSLFLVYFVPTVVLILAMILQKRGHGQNVQKG